MEQMWNLPAPSLEPPAIAGSARTPDIDRIRIARTAIASSALVLATGLIAVTSAATLRIGPFSRTAAASAPSPLIGADTSMSSDFDHGAAGGPAYPAMLIAQDPGEDAWQRLLQGEAAPQQATPISVTKVETMQPFGTVPALSYRLPEAPLPWTKLSAIHGIDVWGQAIAFAGAFPSSPFTRATDPHVAADGTVPTPAGGNTDPAAAATPAPIQSAQSTPPTSQPDPAATSSPPAAPVETAQATIPSVPPPPPQNTDTPPPSDAGSGDTPSSPVSAVPEPASWIGFIFGFGLIGLSRRRIRSRAA